MLAIIARCELAWRRWAWNTYQAFPNHAHAIKIPAGADDMAVRKSLLNDFNIEIGAGLGPFKGQALRIG